MFSNCIDLASKVPKESSRNSRSSIGRSSYNALRKAIAKETREPISMWLNFRLGGVIAVICVAAVCLHFICVYTCADWYTRSVCGLTGHAFLKNKGNKKLSTLYVKYRMPFAYQILPGSYILYEPLH